MRRKVLHIAYLLCSHRTQTQLENLARSASARFKNLETKEIAGHLQRLEVEMRELAVSRTIKFTLTTETSGDLDAVLDALRKHVPDLVVTRSGLQASKSPRMAERYAATLRVTVRQSPS